MGIAEREWLEKIKERLEADQRIMSVVKKVGYLVSEADPVIYGWGFPCVGILPGEARLEAFELPSTYRITYETSILIYVDSDVSNQEAAGAIGDEIGETKGVIELGEMVSKALDGWTLDRQDCVLAQPVNFSAPLMVPITKQGWGIVMRSIRMRYVFILQIEKN